MSSQEYFEEVAPQWEQMQEQFFSNDVRRVAIAAASPTAGETAVDIGAGTGFITAGLIHNGLKVIAVDQSPKMISEMQAKFGPYAAIDYRIGDTEAIPVNDGEADHAFANMVLHHVESPLKAIMEMARIVKPGGKVVITDMETHTHEFLLTEHNDRWLGFDLADVEQWFIAAGLKEVVVKLANETSGCDSTTSDEKAIMNVFVASGSR